MKVLIIDNHDSFTFNLAQLVEQSGLYDTKIIKNEKEDYDASGFDKIIFSPGPGIPSEETGLMKSILKKHSSSKSILGICLGHQAIAEFFSAQLINLNQVYHGIKAGVDITDSTDYLFQGIPEIINGGLYHSWSVNKNNFPGCLKITATSHDGIIMALSHKTFDIKGLQFHPESIMTEYGPAIIRNWLSKT